MCIQNLVKFCPLVLDFFFGEQRVLIKLRFCSSFCLYRAFGFPCLCYSFQVSFNAGFSAFSWLISRFYYWIRRNLPVGRHFGYCFHSRPCFLIDISSRTIYRNFEMFFFFFFFYCFFFRVFLIFFFCSRSVLL